jgi:hypothetical protein
VGDSTPSSIALLSLLRLNLLIINLTLYSPVQKRRPISLKCNVSIDAAIFFHRGLRELLRNNSTTAIMTKEEIMKDPKFILKGTISCDMLKIVATSPMGLKI